MANPRDPRQSGNSPSADRVQLQPVPVGRVGMNRASLKEETWVANQDMGLPGWGKRIAVVTAPSGENDHARGKGQGARGKGQG
jgi:hypothetical protein